MMVLSQKSHFASGALSVDFPLRPANIEANASYGFARSIGNIPGVMSMKRGPDKPGHRNQCIFVRGFHITGRSSLFGFGSKQEVAVMSPNDRPLRLRGGAGSDAMSSEDSECSDVKVIKCVCIHIMTKKPTCF